MGKEAYTESYVEGKELFLALTGARKTTEGKPNPNPNPNPKPNPKPTASAGKKEKRERKKKVEKRVEAVAAQLRQVRWAVCDHYVPLDLIHKARGEQS